MTDKRIAILRQTADYIEANPSEFYWENSAKCTVALLVRNLLGISEEELIDLKIIEGIIIGVWSYYDSTCHPSLYNPGKSTILNSLLEAGFKPGDLHYIEKCGGDTESFNDSFTVTCFLREWANELEQEVTSV